MSKKHEWIKSGSPLYEIASKQSVSGRRHFKTVLHEIYPDESHYNTNGISWNEEYTTNNIDTVIGMSVVAEFLTEDRDIPYGHGLTGVKGNMPLFEDATVVGHFDKACVTDIEIDGEFKKVLVAEGTLDEMRYPKFVEWLTKHMAESQVKGSVEIVGKQENKGEIVYSNGWVEKGRVPQIYDYSGYAILSVTPADESAVVMELNNKNTKESKGEIRMDEAMKVEIQSAVASVLAETNSKWEQYYAQLQAKNAEIAQLEADKAAVEAEIEQLRADYEAAMAKQSLAEAGLAEANEKLGEMEKVNKQNELNAALAGFTDEEKAYAKTEIESFTNDPTSVEINSITGKIYAEIGRKSRENVKHEENSEIDIFSIAGDFSSDSDDEVSIF